MSIFCVNSCDISDKLKHHIHINHRLYAQTHGHHITYVNHLTDDIDFISQSPSCLVINEQNIFLNINIDYTQYLDDSDHYLYLISNSKVKHIKHVIQNTFITRSSNWLRLLLHELKKYRMSISEYINTQIELSDTHIELQNIFIINKPILMYMSDIKTYNYIPQNILLTNIDNLSDDVTIDSVIYINKALGVNYG